MRQFRGMDPLTSDERMALLYAAREVEAGGWDGPPGGESEAACQALQSAMHKLCASLPAPWDMGYGDLNDLPF
jgi:hypothetical protein